jgi:hypothetical protein
MRINDVLVEFAAGGGGSGGNYLKALASAWYNGTFNTGDLHKGIKSQEDVERILERGIHCGDGKIRKYYIGYNAAFDGVEIQSDDHYEHADYDDAGRDIDSRTGQPWGPYDVVEFRDQELDEGELGAVVGSALGGLTGSSLGPVGTAVGAHYGAKAGNAVTGNGDESLSEGPFLPDGPGGGQKGIGGTAKYGMGLADKRNMGAKNPAIQNDLQAFKSWINGGPKPADINDMLTGVDTYFTNIEVPSDARVATTLNQVLRAKMFNPQQVQILNPAIDFLALVIIGCCPVMDASSCTLISKALLFFEASPSPLLTVILVIFGTSWIFLYLNCSRSKGITFSL